MAKKVIGLELDLPVGEAEKKVKSLKSQLRGLKDEMAGLKETDPQFHKLAKEAGQLEDKIGDVNQRVKALASDTGKIDGFVASVQGVAGGFAAAQGAAALFAGENEELQKTFVKVQAAQTLLLGVQQVANTLNKDSAAMIQLKILAEKAHTLALNQSTTAMGRFRLALLATGLGAFIVLLTLLIANWEKVKQALSFVNPETLRFEEYTKKAGIAAREAVDNFDKEARALRAIGTEEKDIIRLREEKLKQAFEANRQEIFLEQQKLDAINKKRAEGFKKFKEDERNEAIDRIKELKEQNDLYKVMKLEGDKEVRKIEADATKKATDEALKNASEKIQKAFALRDLEVAGMADGKAKLIAAEKLNYDKQLVQFDGQAKALEQARINHLARLKQIDADEEKRLDDEFVAEFEKNVARMDADNQKKEQDRLKKIQDDKDYNDLRRSNIADQRQRELETELAHFESEKIRLKDNALALEELETQHTNAIAKIDKDADDRKLAEQQAYENARKELAINAARGIISALADINNAFAGNSEAAARKAFAIQKALNIAETVIGTYSAAQSAFSNILANPVWKLSPDGGITAASIAAGVAIAGGLARVAAISKQQFQGAAQAAPSQGGGSVPAPSQSTNLAPDITRTRLGADDSGELKLKVFVAESDITNTQDRVRGIERRATVE